MKNRYTITCYADLEREERCAKARIEKLEMEIQTRIKKLPEEVVKIGVAKLITGIVSGNMFQSAMSVFKYVRSYFFNKDKDDSEGKSFKDIIMDVLENVFRKSS